MSSFKRQLVILLKKNYLIKGKSKIKFFIQTFTAPILVLDLTLIITPDYKEYPASGFTEEIRKTHKLLIGAKDGLSEQQYNIFLKLKEQIRFRKPKLSDEQINNYFEFFNKSKDMDNYFHDPDNYRGVLGGVWFEHTNDPKIVKYSVRIDSDYVNNNEVQYQERKDSQIYLRHSFTQIQNGVDQAILMASGKDLPIYVSAQRFPNPYQKLYQTWTDGRKMLFKNTAGVFISAALFSGLYSSVITMVLEKENKILEGMKMMGLKLFSYHLSNFITSFYSILPSIFLVTGALSIAQLIYSTPFYILAITIVLYAITLILLSFILCKFLNKSKYAGLLCFGIVLVLSGVGCIINNLDINVGIKAVLCIISPMGITISFYSMVSKDLQLAKAEHPKWDYILSENYVILVFVLDILLYCFIIWYLDNIISGEYGTSKPWYFFLTKDYWLKNSKTIDYESTLGNNGNQDIEEYPTDKDPSICIRNLRKEFKTGDGLRVAVDNLSLNMYQDEIHSFLGQNGSGKSTTIGMLTGLIPPTSGGALVNGYDIHTKIDEIRKSFGIVLQTDILYDSLTVMEHLEIFAAIKGVTDKHLAKSEARRLACELGLESKLDSPVSSLSGGQKRKLCLSIAFIGKSSIILLDEPTSGMDPLSRRQVWDFLINNKRGKTIIFTTHYMDEAEIGDRISIISFGKLRCEGTSLFLKTRFGVGYLLTLTKKSIECKTSSVVSMIQSYIPDAKVLSDAGSELSLRIPKENVSSPKFPKFFDELEARKDSLLISSYGFSVTTLEEVFLKIGEEVTGNQTFNDAFVKKALLTNSRGIKSGQQLKAIFIKRLQTSKKDVKSLVLSIVIPLVVLSVGLLLYKTMGTIEMYNTVTTPLVFSIDRLGEKFDIPFSIKDDDLIQSNATFGFPIRASFIERAKFKQYLHDSFEDKPGALYFPGYKQIEGVEFFHYKVYYNRNYLHTLPIYINYVNNAIANRLANVQIITESRPFEHIKSQFEKATADTNFAATIFFIVFTLAAFCLIASSAGGSITQERSSKTKRLLYISGLKKPVYWISNLLFDYTLSFLIAAFFTVVIVFIDDRFQKNFSLYMSGISLYIVSIIPLAYLLSYKFKTHGIATGLIFAIVFGIGLIMMVISLVLRVWAIKDNNLEFESMTDIIEMVFYSLSPTFCFAKVLIIITNFPGITKVGTNYIDNYWSLYYGFRPIVALASHSIIWLVWILVLDKIPEIKGKLYFDRDIRPPVPPQNEDSDVAYERKRVFLPETQNDPIIINGLHKTFPSKSGNKIAVFNTSLSIPQGQTFGLLGLNGAGKSTTLSILTGDIQPTCGQIKINGYDLKSERRSALRSIGMMPQFDESLVGLLSAKEQLTLYCRIKGVEECQIKDTVEAFIQMMRLTDISNSNVSTYSGGNKRKVSLSIACIGNPSLVLLDEVSCGVDPLTRRFMWSVVTELKKNKVILLTSHSMFECENLCDNVTVMKNGKLICLGSIQHVKNKYGDGYSLDVKFKREFSDTGIEQVLNHFKNSSLIDSHDLIASFELPRNLKISKIFRILQNELKQILEDYSVSQTSLEQVFLKLTNPRFNINNN
ncbi:hypothetical protein DICPUDRAFT_94555 [Dictyostelium purpureum]|uniref:ABC transporter domain-containing protein n=1 Tax=Dictyostelium purpureum TaxID=5786 RepID=F0ZKW5_DICPU|nr:uncharacterized protein DICPUDRAFT_94555 [Dictyostelium purpureum]EGC35447.1 hypothetical protein DICPUDRAFT_94555 [Dictyostelium purpureum]|eukprot:XP_003288060.1 hypothetical protein DICPUDRAFT_94555 [Dictyostelium purpureum]